MERLSYYLLLDICLYLDFKDLLTIARVQKVFRDIVMESNLWRFWVLRAQRPSSFYSGAFFKFPKANDMMEKLHIQSNPQSITLDKIKLYHKAINNPKSIIGLGVEASSQDYDQGISCTLSYDNNRFWSSSSNESPETNEYLLYKLKTFSIVFSVHFKLYRAGYQGGIIYPPKQARIKIGNSKTSFHYTSEEFDIPKSENYNTILLLPNIIEGKYVMLELLGKVIREPDTERFYNVVSFVEIIGYPLSFIDSPEKDDKTIEDLIKSKDVPSVLTDPRFLRTPFLYERVLDAGILNDILLAKIEIGTLNEIESYFAAVIKSEILKDGPKDDTDPESQENSERTERHLIYKACKNIRLYPSEIIANLYLELGNYEEAKNNYNGIRDIWGIIKPLIVLKEYNILRYVCSIQDTRTPKLDYIIKIARELGDQHEVEIRKALVE